MQDDETDLEHILRLDVRWRRHAGQTSLRAWILDRCRLEVRLSLKTFASPSLRQLELLVFR